VLEGKKIKRFERNNQRGLILSRGC